MTDYDKIFIDYVELFDEEIIAEAMERRMRIVAVSQIRKDFVVDIKPSFPIEIGKKSIYHAQLSLLVDYIMFRRKFK